MIDIGNRARPGGKKHFGPGRPFFLIAAVLVLCAALGCKFFYTPVLVVKDTETGQALLIGTIGEGDSFELHFIHSVDRLPVQDLFVYRDGTLVLDRTRCLSFGAGLGYAGQGVLKGDNGWNVIENMNRRVGTIPLRVGTVADHTIIYRGERFQLDRYFTPQSLIRIGVENKWRL